VQNRKEEKMPKTKPVGKKAPLPNKKSTPTSARMMKLRPHDQEPLEKAAEPQEKPEAAAAEEEGKKKPRQPRLPGIQDPEIEELETLAEEYVSFRDRRQELTLDEVRLKQELLNAMNRYNRESYVHGGIEIKVVHKDTTVKVKVHKDED
jgi:hypothetical protein